MRARRGYYAQIRLAVAKVSESMFCNFGIIATTTRLGARASRHDYAAAENLIVRARLSLSLICMLSFSPCGWISDLNFTVSIGTRLNYLG